MSSAFTRLRDQPVLRLSGEFVTAECQLLDRTIRYSNAALTQTEALMLLVGMALDGYLQTGSRVRAE